MIPAQIETSNAEMKTIREAMRQLTRMVEALDRTEVRKFVLMKGNRMRAIVIHPDEYAALKRKAEGR